MPRSEIPPSPRSLPAGLDRFGRLLSPPRCLGCRRLAGELPDLGLCPHCRSRLGAVPPTVGTIRGIDSAAVATSYEGAAVALVAALKTGRVPAAAETMAELICESTPAPGHRGAVLVPVPSGRSRRLLRGLEPAEQIAISLSRRLELPPAPLLRRLEGRAQRGRSRAGRLADPPRVEAGGDVSAGPVLVDDVITTGATLRACALALRAAGASSVGALCFALTPPPGARRGSASGSRGGRD